MTALTEADFQMTYDAGHTFPFFETEDAVIMAYGHHEQRQFAVLVKQYDDLCNGGPAYEGQHGPDEIRHVWATVEGSSEDDWRATWYGVTADTPDAIPLTVIFR